MFWEIHVSFSITTGLDCEARHILEEANHALEHFQSFICIHFPLSMAGLQSNKPESCFLQEHLQGMLFLQKDLQECMSFYNRKPLAFIEIWGCLAA